MLRTGMRRPNVGGLAFFSLPYLYQSAWSRACWVLFGVLFAPLSTATSYGSTCCFRTTHGERLGVILHRMCLWRVGGCCKNGARGRVLGPHPLGVGCSIENRMWWVSLGGRGVTCSGYAERAAAWPALICTCFGGFWGVYAVLGRYSISRREGG